MSYCPFASMLCSRRSNNLVNNIPERALRATFDDHTSNFTQLLEKKRESTIPSTHERNLQIYKQPISSYYRPHVRE